MKVKWRLHELILVTCIIILTIGKAFRSQPGINLNFLAQAGSLILLYLAWLFLNRVMVPMAVASVKQNPGRWLRIFGVLVQFFALTYILGPGVNFISFYVAPSVKFFTDMPLVVGSHPQPFLNNIGGWDTSLALVGLYCIYAFIREAAIHYIEKPRADRAYRVLVTNKATNWAAIAFAVPFVVMVAGTGNATFYHAYFAFETALVITILACYYWLFPSQSDKGWRDGRFLLKLFLLVLCDTILGSVFLGDHWHGSLVAWWFAVQLLFVIPVTWFFYRGRKDALLELIGTKTELARSKADIVALRAQINPHFLFNALNTLYAISLRDKSMETAAGIQQLGDMMRFMLEDNQQEYIPMSSELGYLHNYIALERLRIQESNDLQIDADIDDVNCNGLIAPMLLIPFVENAFKHGIRLDRRSWISIRLECAEKELSFKVVNSLHPRLVNDMESGRSGIGLQNVRDRLLLLYPGRHELHYGSEDDAFVVTLKLNIQA
ncbi:MAG TPA: histidine kinase [Puia sp.]|nr:histidine kinase [Puia sp.]